MIRAKVEVEDRSGAFMMALHSGQVAGLISAGRAYQRDMKRALRGGAKGYVFKTSVGNKGNVSTVNKRFAIEGDYYGKTRSFTVPTAVRRPWYTGLLWNSVTVSTVESTPTGSSLRVGTNVKYALYWELGHHNIFTKHFERDEKWVPTYRDNSARYADAFARAFSAAMRDVGKGAENAFADNDQQGYIGQGGEGIT